VLCCSADIFVRADGIYLVGFYFYYPETKGKTLEELQGLFGDKVADVNREPDDELLAEKLNSFPGHVEGDKEATRTQASSVGPQS
jgi:hypothetical protein